ncbi:MAG TPA: hypothetical protein VFT72_15610 [Opitutaceae bacterium]|nr:hypothetical protein [Opitutaceae bacterium]
MLLRKLGFLALVLSCLTAQAAEPLSKTYPIDFYRDIPSRNLKGLATRSDGRLVSGPVLTDLNGPELPQLLWCLEPDGENRWLVGSGPDGKIIEVTLTSANEYSVRPIIALDEPQVQVVKRMADGSLLAGTSPNGTLALIRDGKIVSSAALPADSIFDIVLREDTAYVATGNPAKIFKVNLRAFATAGADQTRTKQLAELKGKGIDLFGEIRDRNVRRLAWSNGRLVAGSSPKGNIYAFPISGGPAQLLQENRDAEVSALLPVANGDLYAAVVFTNGSSESRINRPASGKSGSEAVTDIPPATPIERFAGRSAVVYLPKTGFPETLVSRSGLAFYALAKVGNTLLIAGGEQGDILGYDLATQQGLSFAGSDSAQVNALASIGTDGSTKFLALRNNTSGLAVIDFAASGQRVAETRRLDLGIASTVGAFRLNRLVNASPDQVHVEFRGNIGSDEIEGWSPWVTAERRADGWFAPDFRARNVRLRIQIDPTPNAMTELDSSQLFYLPQNRRPQLSEFRVAPSNYVLLAGGEAAPPNITTLAQLLANPDRDKAKNPILNYNVAPEPGNQLITWVVVDPDGDTLGYTFSIKREGSDQWTDVAVATRDTYAQFNTAHLEDGIYRTRLIAAEQSPRPIADRLTSTFDTDEIVIDNTPPEIAELKISKESDGLKLLISGHDAMSVLQGAEFNFNNGFHDVVLQPADNIRDSQTETFVLQVPAQKVAGATAVEIALGDLAGNVTTRRVNLP